MKYVSLLLIVFCLAFTWQLSRTEDPVSVKVHHELQTAVTEIIQAAVIQHLPGATEFRFSKLYTETLNEHTVQAFFGYSFRDENTEDPTERNIDGTAILIRDTADASKWVLEDIQVNQTAIEFKEGTIIKAGEDTPL